MSTGTIQDAVITLMPNPELRGLHLGYVNTSGSEITKGTLVKLTGNMEVAPVDSANDIQVGIVTVKGGNNEEVTALTPFMTDLRVNAGAALVAGNLVRPDGNYDADGRPTYVIAAAGSFAYGVVMQGAAANAEARVGIFRSPITAK